MATYEIQCDNTMDNALFVETNKRKAMRRAKLYVAGGDPGKARANVRKLHPKLPLGLIIGGYQIGADGKLRRVS